ncbi:MAG TPA: GNAT family N-acetyltransferase [Phycisphaerae bacterium]|nr:GNAT family N-acetyltransferase [Phycisphaerae bacterium]
MYFVQFSAAKVVPYPDPKAFENRVKNWLTVREAENSYFLGHMGEIAAMSQHHALQLFTIEEQGQLVATGVLFPNGTLCLTWTTQEQTEVVVNYAAANRWRVLSVFAPGHVAWWFAQSYADKTGQRAAMGRAERVYQLTQNSYELPTHGHLEVATPADKKFLREWIEGFVSEAGFETENQTPDSLMELLIAPRLLYLWKSPEPVAMAAWVAPTPHGGSINFVYTPPEFRGQGYGKAVTAALGAQMLASGLRYCFILTDVDDVRSNSIYQKIGARTVAEFMRALIEPRHQMVRPSVQTGSITV